MNVTSSNVNNDLLQQYGYILKQPTEDLNIDYSKVKLDNIVHKTIMDNRLTVDDLENIDIRQFYYKSVDIYRELDKLADIEKGAKILVKAINNNKNILCVTDYDLDGITSASTMYRSLVDIYVVNRNNVDVIVNRRRDGNGFNNTLVSRILEHHKNKPIDLIITADHGSANEDAFKLLKEKIGCEIIVTDHHTVPEVGRPVSVDAFINPMLEESTIVKEISGCTVVFLFLLKGYQLLMKSSNLHNFNSVLPYVGLSVIGDVMSLKYPINRFLVRVGLFELNKYNEPLWIGLKKVLGIPGSISIKDIGFKLGPLINTGNRLGVEDLVFKLLTSTNINQVYDKAKELNRLNLVRKNFTKNVMNVVDDNVRQNRYRHSTVVAIESEYAIAGIVASNITGNTNTPTVCFIDNATQDIISGSARSPNPGPSLVDILNDIHNEDPNIIIGHGGHAGAAGVTIKVIEIERFKELFDKYCYKHSSKIEKSKYIEIDIVLDEKHIEPGFVMSILELGPYGKDWAPPVFLTQLKVQSVFRLGSTNIYKIKFRLKSGLLVESIYRCKDPIDIVDMFPPNSDVLVVYELNLDSYNNNYSFILDIKDIQKVKG